MTKPSKPKLAVVPEDPAAGYAFLMAQIREINALLADDGFTEQLSALTAGDLPDLEKAAAFLEKLKQRMAEELTARANRPN